MFTGLVEGQGTVSRITALPAGLRLTIVPDASCFDVHELRIGDSVAICGCCLTVVALTDDGVEFEAGQETLSKTTLGLWTTGQRVNLERSLRADARLGGHFVQGHVDGTATVSRIVRSADWSDLWFRATAEQLRLMVPKGSVAVDGVSLTVVNVTDSEFSVALIPHTLQVTTLGLVTEGSRVNIETDVLGRYVEKLLHARFAVTSDQ